MILQCPYVLQSVENLRQFCQLKGVPLHLMQVDTCKKPRNYPVCLTTGVFLQRAIPHRERGI